MTEFNLDRLINEPVINRPWPTHGQTYDLIIEVEYIGLQWDDKPDITLQACPEAIREVFYDLDIREACRDDYRDKTNAGRKDGYTLPIASGLYKVRLEFWFHDRQTTEGYDCDYGFYVRALEKLQ